MRFACRLRGRLKSAESGQNNFWAVYLKPPPPPPEPLPPPRENPPPEPEREEKLPEERVLPAEEEAAAAATALKAELLAPEMVFSREPVMALMVLNEAMVREGPAEKRPVC